jgi:predicted transcriptional regulator
VIINIDLEEEVIEKVDKQAEKEERSRKKMLELIIKRSVQ